MEEIEPNEDFVYYLETYKTDETLWKKIMNEIHIPIKYLTHLYKTTEYGIPIHGINVFQQTTFQEYIDSIINLQSLGSYDYQKFIQSMQDEGFKNNMIKKYNHAMYMNIVKNYIIYVVQLYLSRNNEISTIFTDEECAEMDLSINIIPYIEYLSSKQMTIGDINDTNDTNELCEPIEFDETNDFDKYLELQTINYINNRLYK